MRLPAPYAENRHWVPILNVIGGLKANVKRTRDGCLCAEDRIFRREGTNHSSKTADIPRMLSLRLALAEPPVEAAEPEQIEISASPHSQTGGSVAIDQILFVDDDKYALDGYKRLLHGEFRVATASGGDKGLAALQLMGPFAIVISDMRMPGMSGSEFLAKVRTLSPQTVRMLLTGYKDINQAIEAVNESQIFRYLTKPCVKDELTEAIRLGLIQYHANLEESELIKEAKERRLAAAIPAEKPYLIR
jgi:CheY-like chemotaxis protein